MTETINTQKKRRKFNKIYDLEVLEISAVDRGANMQKYFLYKQASDPPLPATMAEMTPEQEAELNKQFNNLMGAEKMAILKELESISASIDEDPDDEFETMRKAVGVITETLESLKKSDPLTWAEVTEHPENYLISDDFRTFTRKPDAPTRKVEKFWSEELKKWVTREWDSLNQRYVTKANVGWKEKKDVYGRVYHQRED